MKNQVAISILVIFLSSCVCVTRAFSKRKSIGFSALKLLNNRQQNWLCRSIDHRKKVSLRMGQREDLSVSSKIARLNSMAQQLRAEAAELEAEQRQQSAKAAMEAFKNFDTNQDGTVNVEELRSGIEKAFKLSVSASQAEKLMKSFDASGDGLLQPEEFKGLEEFRLKLESLASEEKAAAIEAVAKAAKEKRVAEISEIRASAIEEVLNEKPPTVSDRVVSVLPYLFPLLDSLNYGEYFIRTIGNQGLLTNYLLLFYKIYATVPFAGLVAFFTLNFFSNNLKLNRLVRFNIRQAIFLDIALVFPGILAGVVEFLLPEIGIKLPDDFVQITSTGTFLLFSVPILYSVFCSLLAVTPDQIPFISDRVNKLLPSKEAIEEFFDEEGNLRPEEEIRKRRDEKEKNDKKNGD